jgi:hypothetical protein
MRLFTEEEANHALESVRPLVERLVEARRRFVQVAGRLEEVEGRVSGNGSALPRPRPTWPASSPRSRRSACR